MTRPVDPARVYLACPLCGCPGGLISYARVAPFIEDLSGRPAAATLLLECRDCDLAWFSHRFDEPSMKALYGGYRGATYLRTRRRWEPWYSASLNAALEPGGPAVAERIDFMVGVLDSAISIGELRNIVDVGGDAGQFFPPFAGSKYVVDVSGKKLVEGVLAFQSLADLPEPPHLLISAHLLEHLPDPVTFVRSLREVISADGHLYVEVPLDRPRVGRWHATTAYDRFLGLMRRTRPTWILADFAAGAARNVGWPVPWPGAVKQSEHINYFSERSLTALLSNAGFRVTQVRSDPGASLRGLRLGTLAVLAVPV
jgi:hypothetical protein